MSVTPFLRIPVTDFTGYALNHQLNGRCADLEMKMMDCLEAYGRGLGKTKCQDIIEDFKECNTRAKQFDRVVKMRYERHRQYYMNERKDHYEESPKIDSF